jgi:procollagen-lysine,2-oxoglutarate 5-dioxygenase, invertebrate
MSSSECHEDKCDYLFVIDSLAHIDLPDTLIHLITLNRTVIAPMLVRPEKTWSNFWGDYTDEGFYKRSPDYMDIINQEKKYPFVVYYFVFIRVCSIF